MQGSNILCVYGPGLWFVMAYIGKSPHCLVSLWGGSGVSGAEKAKRQSVNFDLPLSDSDRGKSTVDGFTLVVGRHMRLAPESQVPIFYRKC